MFFTRCAKIAAWLSFVLGSLTIALGILIAFDPSNMEIRAAFPGKIIGPKFVGSVIVNGLLLMGIGIALGVLSEISRSLKPKEDSE